MEELHLIYFPYSRSMSKQWTIMSEWINRFALSFFATKMLIIIDALNLTEKVEKYFAFDVIRIIFATTTTK